MTPPRDDVLDPALHAYAQPSQLKCLAMAAGCTFLVFTSLIGTFVLAAYVHGWRPC